MHNLIDRADKLLTLKETKKENQKKKFRPFAEWSVKMNMLMVDKWVKWTQPCYGLGETERERGPLTALRPENFQCNKRQFKSVTTKYLLSTNWQILEINFQDFWDSFLHLAIFQLPVILPDQTETTSRKYIGMFYSFNCKATYILHVPI